MMIDALVVFFIYISHCVKPMLQNEIIGTKNLSIMDQNHDFCTQKDEHMWLLACPDLALTLTSALVLDAAGGRTELNLVNMLHKRTRACAELPYAVYYTSWSVQTVARHLHNVFPMSRSLPFTVPRVSTAHSFTERWAKTDFKITFYCAVELISDCVFFSSYGW